MAEASSAAVVFVDVRGFTRWAEANEVFANLDRFVLGLLDILKRRFPDPEYSIKPLGDGAMIVGQLPDKQNPREVTQTLGRIFSTIRRVESDFAKHCQDFANMVGHTADLSLGWGVVRGKIISVGNDWAGHNLNKCARLCSEARPFGILIDRDDFPVLPRDSQGLTSQVRRLRGIGEARVWVSNEIVSQFVTRERLRETPEVHVAGTCFVEEKSGSLRLLLARRSPDRRLFPDKYEGCGGQLRYSEGFAEGVRRHFRQELRIDVQVLPHLHSLYEIREANSPIIPGIRFLCRKIGDDDPVSDNHSDLIWVSDSDFRRMPAEKFVGELKQEVIALVDQYYTLRGRGSDV